LREIDHGRWEQLRRDDVHGAVSGRVSRVGGGSVHLRADGRRVRRATARKSITAIRRIVAAHEGHEVLVVSHKATIRLVIASLLGIDLRGYRDCLDQSLASLNILDFTSRTQTKLTLFNDVSRYAERSGDLQRAQRDATAAF
jgi:probable phosphoglycerate mutase